LKYAGRENVGFENFPPVTQKVPKREGDVEGMRARHRELSTGEHPYQEAFSCGSAIETYALAKYEDICILKKRSKLFGKRGGRKSGRNESGLMIVV